MPRSKNAKMDRTRFEVPPGELRWECDAACLGFASTEEIEPLEPHVFINQPRAEEAIETGIALPGHMFIVTSDGAITSVLLENIRRKASHVPHCEIWDVVCVHNRAQPEKPRFIKLQKGKAIPFAASIKKLGETLKHKMREVLASDASLRKGQAIMDEFDARIKEAHRIFGDALDSANLEVPELGTLIFMKAYDNARRDVIDQFGNVVISAMLKRRGVAPGRDEQEEQDLLYPLRAIPEFRSLPDERQEEILAMEREKVRDLQMRYLHMHEEINALSEKMLKEIVVCRSEFVDTAFRRETEAIIQEYGAAVFSFIDMLREHTIERVEEFLPKENDQNHAPVIAKRPDPLAPFEVNVFVDNSSTDGVPVIDDRNPTYERIFGEVTYTPTFTGPYHSDHTTVRAGALSKADGGYLILPARAVFADPYIWSRLKAVLESKRLDVGVLSGAGSVFGKSVIFPEPLQVNTRIILVGDRLMYDILNSHPWLRQDFEELFKVAAEFDWETQRTDTVTRQYARLIRSFCERGDLPPVSADGVSQILEYACRKAGTKEKLSLDARAIKAILNEAGYLARKEDPGATLISGNHVSDALQKRIYRVDLIREKIYAYIKDGTLLIRVEGSKVGQVNGLVVYSGGDLSFGSVARITVSTYAGRQGVVNIEREAELSGRTHNKGVLILTGYLGEKYARRRPLSFTASISFEQSYSGVEGDSASATELYAILSSLSGLPLRQDIAVTGSVSQKGEIQPIGGVNQKIEGFFDICQLKGVTGSPGVLIPQQNIKNLMLRSDVVKAISDGKFHVWAAQTVDEGIEILTGVKSGEPITRGERKGQYRKGTVNWLVSRRLEELARSAGATSSLNP